jgi:hypothetical protein
MAGKDASPRRRTLSSGGSPCRGAGPNRRSNPSAVARVRALLDSPAYREAGADIDFLASGDARSP